MATSTEYTSVAPPLSLGITVFVPDGDDKKSTTKSKNVAPELYARMQNATARSRQLGAEVRKKVEKPKQTAKREAPSSKTNPKEINSVAVQKIKQYMNPNPQLRDIPHGRLGEKTPGELEIEEAITQGDYGRAISLSDKFQTHESATQILNAISCVRYSECKKEEERILRLYKKPRLDWTFDSKARWERKGNM